MPFEIIRGDITEFDADAVVNAANSRLFPGGGVCGALFNKAGYDELFAECAKIGHCSRGGAVITRGYALKARHIIHTVGPIWQGGEFGEDAQLSACYTNSLALAQREGLRSIAFPLISAGIFGYPQDRALTCAVQTIGAYLASHEEMDVYLILFDTRDKALGEALFPKLKQLMSQAPAQTENDIPDGDAHMPFCADESLARKLNRLIDESGLDDATLSRRANLHLETVREIRKNPLCPSPDRRGILLALAIAMQLAPKDVRALQVSFGCAPSGPDRTQLIVESFLEQGIYDIYTVNVALYFAGESQLCF